MNGHNKNILNKQEKPSPCNCRDKTSCLLKGSYQHKNLVCSCKVSIPDLKQNHPHHTWLTEHTFKDLCKRNAFKYKSKRNWTELSNSVWGKKKEKINVDLAGSNLDKANP